jgi:NHLM bacteriocin system ABC transporter peptidase/ATP-binding protein
MSAGAAALRLTGRFGRPGRVRATPTVLQMEAVECGAAALAAVLAYYGCWRPLEELRVACGVSRDGSRASNILKAARQYGLSGKGYRKEPAQLGELPLPSILHWNFNHFVVLEGIRGSWAYINDPGSGRRRVSLTELSECFTGVVLAFEPTAQFRRDGAPPRAVPMLWRMLAGSRSGLALVALISLTLVLPGIIVPAFARLFVDDVVIGRSAGWIGPLLTGMALTAVLRALIVALRQVYLLRLETKLGLAMASRFLWHVLRLPVGFFTQRHAGDIAARVAASQDIAQLLSGELATTVLDLAMLGLFAVAMAAYDVQLAAVAVLLGLLSLVALRFVGRSRVDLARTLAQDRGRLSAATVDVIHTIETIKSAGVEHDAFARWAGHHARTMGATQALDRKTVLIGLLPPVLSTFGNAAILGIGSLRIMHGAMSVGDLVAFQTLAASFLEPIARLVGLATRLQQIKADLARVSDVLSYPVEHHAAQPEAETAPAGPARLSGAITLKDVTFGYDRTAQPLIESFSLDVRPGQRIALVGGSGSGKSTLGRLICGLYPVWSGEVRFDGRPLGEIPRGVLANSLAYIDQDVFLFAGTVRENISLWDDSVDEAQLARALRDAAIFDEVSLRPGLYDHVLIEDGLNFSGGQRQRLEIARALVGEPSILVLDEATAALDPIVEAQIDANIRRRGCTCIIIAHRYSTIRDCDEIIVLKKGRVVGRGTHAELMESCPHYVALRRSE